MGRYQIVLQQHGYTKKSVLIVEDNITFGKTYSYRFDMDGWDSMSQ